ncbi:MAG TPA: hypothetical protein VN303_08675 [Pseudomonas sp.]|nr:hypothetical protein [Pseudomonas sp.]
MSDADQLETFRADGGTQVKPAVTQLHEGLTNLFRKSREGASPDAPLFFMTLPTLHG